MYHYINYIIVTKPTTSKSQLNVLVGKSCNNILVKMVRRNKYSEKVMTPGKQKYKKNSYLELHRLQLKNIFMHKSKTTI